MKRHAASRFVGRVGGLAVALGVGAVISLGAPTSWADDAAADGTSGSSAAGENAPNPDADATGSPSKSPAVQPNSPEKESGADDDAVKNSPSDDAVSVQAGGHPSEPESGGSTPDSAAAETPDASDRGTARHRSPRKSPVVAGDSSPVKSDSVGSGSERSTPVASRDAVPARVAATRQDVSVAAVDVVRQPPTSVSMVVAPATSREHPLDTASEAPTPVASVVVAPEIALASEGLQGVLGDDLRSLATPMVLVMAGAARRELGNTDAGLAAIPFS